MKLRNFTGETLLVKTGQGDLVLESEGTPDLRFEVGSVVFIVPLSVREGGVGISTEFSVPVFGPNLEYVEGLPGEIGSSDLIIISPEISKACRGNNFVVPHFESGAVVGLRFP